MNGKEMIEEMAREFEKCCEEKATNTCGSNCHYCTAEIMFNLGYRKIPKGSVVLSKEEKQKLLKEMYEQGKFDALADLEKDGKVVLSKEEYELLKSLEESYEHLEKTKDDLLSERSRLTLQFARARKETAKEILQVIEKAKENGQIYYNESFMITAKGAYGVEE